MKAKREASLGKVILIQSEIKFSKPYKIYYDSIDSNGKNNMKIVLFIMYKLPITFLEVLTIMYGKKQVTFDVEKLNYWPFRLSYINVKKYLETNWSDLVRPFTTIDKLSIEKYLTTASEG